MSSHVLINALHIADYKKVDRLLKGPNDLVSGNESYLLTTAVSVRSSDAVPIEQVILNIQTLLNHKPLCDGIKKDSVPNILASAIQSGHALVIYCLLKESFIVNAFEGNDISPVVDALETAKDKIVCLLLKSTLGKYIIPDDDSSKGIEQVEQPTALNNTCQFFRVDSSDNLESSIAEAMSEAQTLSADFESLAFRSAQLKGHAHGFLHHHIQNPVDLESLNARIIEIENASDRFTFYKSGKKRNNAGSSYSSFANYLGFGS